MEPTKKDIIDGALWRYTSYSSDILYNAKFNDENGLFLIKVHNDSMTGRSDNWSAYSFKSFQQLFRLHRSETEFEILRLKSILQILASNGVTGEIYELLVELGI